MYYEINVSKKAKNGMYKHYFATAERSLDSLSEAQNMVIVFMEKFPEPKFKINVTRYEETIKGWDEYSFINVEE